MKSGAIIESGAPGMKCVALRDSKPEQISRGSNLVMELQ